MAFCVVATYGNTRRIRWCTGIRKREAADKLQAVAVEHGFTDAEVWDEREYAEMVAESARGQAYPRRPHKESR